MVLQDASSEVSLSLANSRLLGNEVQVTAQGSTARSHIRRGGIVGSDYLMVSDAEVSGNTVRATANSGAGYADASADEGGILYGNHPSLTNVQMNDNTVIVDAVAAGGEDESTGNALASAYGGVARLAGQATIAEGTFNGNQVQILAHGSGETNASLTGGVVFSDNDLAASDLRIEDNTVSATSTAGSNNAYAHVRGGGLCFGNGLLSGATIRGNTATARATSEAGGADASVHGGAWRRMATQPCCPTARSPITRPWPRRRARRVGPRRPPWEAGSGHSLRLPLCVCNVARRVRRNDLRRRQRIGCDSRLHETPGRRPDPLRPDHRQGRRLHAVQH